MTNSQKPVKPELFVKNESKEIYQRKDNIKPFLLQMVGYKDIKEAKLNLGGSANEIYESLLQNWNYFVDAENKIRMNKYNNDMKKYSKEQTKKSQQEFNNKVKVDIQQKLQKTAKNLMIKEEQKQMKKIKNKYRNVLNDISMKKPKIISIKQLINKVDDYFKVTGLDINSPFEFTLNSGVINLTRKFKFSNFFHFQNYWDKVLNSGEVIDYDYTNTYNYDANKPNELFEYNFKNNNIGKHKVKPLSQVLGSKNHIKNILQKSDQNVFRQVILSSIAPIQAGCNKHTKTDKFLKTAFYEYTLFNPVSRSNNCFFKCLEKILNTAVDIKKLRRELNLPTETKITINQAYYIIKHVSPNVKIQIIDWEQNEELNEDEFYILIKDEHYYVVESFKEVIKKDRKTKRGLLTFDFETRPTEDYNLIKASNTKSFILKDTICGVYFKRYNGGKNDDSFIKNKFVTNNEKSSARQFLDWLNNEITINKTYNIIAHNGGNFDFYFLVEAMTQQELKDCQIQMRGTTIISINYKGHLFKDSYCFMTFSLEKLSENFKIEEGKMVKLMVNNKEISSTQLCFYKPYLTFNQFLELQQNDTDFWDKYTEYCIRDCVALYQIWEKFTECVNNLLSTINPYLLRFCPLMSSSTIGSHSKKILNTLNKPSKEHTWVGKDKRKMDLFLKEGKELDMEKYKFLCQFKRGGISHCNKAGLHRNGIAPVDIKSQYPASLIYSKIPVGFSRWTNTYEEKSHGFYHLKNLKFDTDCSFKPIATKKSNGVLDWNTDNFVEEVFIDSYTIRYLKQHYNLIEFDVITGLVSNEDIQGDKLFGKYVNTFYKEKQRQDALKDIEDNTYNPALRETIKLYLNALTGKLVEDPERHFSLKFNDDAEKKLNGTGITKEFNDDKYNDWLIAGIMVYSYSKRLLFEYIRCLPKDSNSVIHIETDGIYFDMRDKEEFDNNLNNYTANEEFPCVKYGDELGNLDYETKKASYEGQPAYFLGKKFYCITGKTNTYKIKGIPQSTIDDEGNKIQLVDENLYKMVYDGKIVKKSFKTMKRNLFGEHTQITSHTASRTINPNQKYIQWK